MQNQCRTLLITCLLSPLLACQQSPNKPESIVAAQLQQSALSSNLAYDLVESLTVEVGPRLAGSDKDLVAVQWAENKLNQLGFDKVYKEAVQVPIWSRGAAKAELISPYPQSIVITALGGSISTPKQGITAPIVRFDSLATLESAQADNIKGKIVFIDNVTQRHMTGKGYSETVGGRSKGAVAASKKGAVAIVIRSIGTDHDRMAHTGMMRYQDGIAKIPAAAMSNPDAEQINLMLKRDPNVVLKLTMSPQSQGYADSYNVIAEITGSSKPEEIVLIGAHLDSWDEGTGAIDNGAGVAIVTAAAKLIQQLPSKPARTIRVVLFAAEEVGIVGAKAYAQAHKHELDKHYIAAESDFGAGNIYQIDYRVNKANLGALHQLSTVMTNNGVKLGSNTASGGPDVSILPAQGVPVASLRQNGQDYFDYHHTPNDTLDKIDPAQLQQNVAVYAQFAYLMAQSDVELRPIATR